MSYAVVTALLFAFVAIMHGWRIYKRWTVQIGPHSISMNVSWVGLVVAPACDLGFLVDLTAKSEGSICLPRWGTRILSP
jgi:hypothetical protein